MVREQVRADTERRRELGGGAVGQRQRVADGEPVRLRERGMHRKSCLEGVGRIAHDRSIILNNS